MYTSTDNFIKQQFYHVEQKNQLSCFTQIHIHKVFNTWNPNSSVLLTDINFIPMTSFCQLLEYKFYVSLMNNKKQVA